jgi:NitT/TauT family transport system substrate-binding protein
MMRRTAGSAVKYGARRYDRFPVARMGGKGEVPTDPAGLRGKTIGTPGKFGSSWAALLALLKAGGLTVDDITVREYPQFNQADGLAQGDVDLITGFRNNAPLRLESQGIAVDQLTIDQIAPLPGPGIISGDTTLTSSPTLVRAFAEATARGQAAVIADPSAGVAAAEVAVPTIKEDRDAALAVLTATAELWKGESGFRNGAIDMARWRSAYDTMRDLGFIDGSVPVDEMVAPAS